MKNSEIKIYKTPEGKTSIEVKLEKDMVWLSLNQMSDLFERDKSVISRHINNIYKEGELERSSTVAKIATVQKEGKREIIRNIEYFNLDVIISVGYRIKSKRGTQFRIWANQVIKDYLIKGYSINQQRLQKQVKQLNELKETIKILGNTLEYKELTNDESKGLLKLISNYSYALELLDQYDYQTLKIENTSGKEVYQLTYEEAIKQIELVKKTYGNSELFGNEKDDSFKSSIATIYQTFGGIDLYPSIEEKAANLLYFIVKNHSFSDGNKRIAAFLFLYFLEKNELLFSETGEKRIADNALVALTLMIAVSKPDEKETMIKVIVNLINKNN
ncbi:MAG: cytochrome C biogenesis protein CycH [Bacteroidetes bacterium]|nr:MAG: cytochrome C biogenesis protein CycH [Bacteroidota bacterium]